MIRQILGMTCQIIVVHILCPVIYFSHSLLHGIITPVIMHFLFFGIHLFFNHRKIFLCSKGQYTCNVHENWPIFKNPYPLVQLLPKFFHPLDCGRAISNKPPCSQCQLINLVFWLSIHFYLFSCSQPHPQSYLKTLKTSFSPSSYSEQMCWGKGWAKASLSTFLWLYILVCTVVQKYHKMVFIYNYSQS